MTDDSRRTTDSFDAHRARVLDRLARVWPAHVTLGELLARSLRHRRPEGPLAVLSLENLTDVELVEAVENYVSPETPTSPGKQR